MEILSKHYLEKFSIPTKSCGIDIQNYATESELIYTLDISEVEPNDIEGERLITKKLKGVNCKVFDVIQLQFEKIVWVIGDIKS